MIFVTVGTQLPFDRLVMAMDAWAGLHPEQEVFAQIGGSTYAPKHMQWAKHLDPGNFRNKYVAAQRVVSHAGMGNVLLALELGKPLILMPRRAGLKEHRNDHQLATVNWLKDKPGIAIAQDAVELEQALQMQIQASNIPFRPHASEELLTAVRTFIEGT
jgi:UDP-N-acetylglucosamine transferase subunit ALG13